MCIAGVISYEYQKNKNFTPITNRKQFAAIPRSVELKYQNDIISSLYKQYSENNIDILDEMDPLYSNLNKIVRTIAKACVYFSPECEEYMHNIKVIIVNSDEINACSMMGIPHLFHSH